MRTTDPWSFFDRIYCISLLERGDRQAAAAKQFQTVGLAPRVEFVLVPKHPLNREEGIYTSHMRCLQQGLDQGARHILVFEDDVFFKGVDARRLDRALRHLAGLGSWQGFFLGCLCEEYKKTDEPSIVRIGYRSLAHAYALHASFARELVRLSWCGIPFDELLHRHCHDAYALFPMCAFQGLMGSDNQRTAITWWRNFCGGLPWIQRCFEMYQRHKPALIILHVISLAALGAGFLFLI